ncbi:MAG: hypothetical protein E6K53_01690, partial [Gammaproteobacteria bacterium]
MKGYTMRLIDRFSRLFLLTIFLTLSPASFGLCKNVDNKELRSIIGTWVLRSIYETSNIKGPSPLEQKKLLETTVTIGPEVLKSCGQSIPIKSTATYQLSAGDFLENT